MNSFQDKELSGPPDFLYYPKGIMSQAGFLSWIALIILCLTWELFLAPLPNGNGYLALKALPLFCALPGLRQRRIYTLQWASLLIWLYFAEGIVRAMSDLGVSSWYAVLEIILSLLFFITAVTILYPIKQHKRRAHTSS